MRAEEALREDHTTAGFDPRAAVGLAAFVPRAGKLVVLEGLDGSGKETQTGLLAQALRDADAEVRVVSFPVYSSEASGPVRMYLAGNFGARPGDVNAYAASSFYAVDRAASYFSDWRGFYEAGGLVLADRYTTSNAVHQCSKLPREQWDEYLEWLFDFEYRLLGIPQPDLVVYLSVSAEAGRRLVEQRCARDGVAKDIHERDEAYLARCREAAEYCAARCGWTRVECAPGGVLRSIEDIHAEIAEIVKARELT